MTLGEGICYAAFWLSLAAVMITFVICAYKDAKDERHYEIDEDKE